MFQKPIRFLKQLRSLQRINLSLARAAATAPLRQLDPANPNSWEFCGFSQHGEDGIIDYLTRQLKTPNHYFIEIGASHGLENNSSWLALGRMSAGLMIDGDPVDSEWCKFLITPLNCGVEVARLFVTRDNAAELKALALHSNPDVFSLDIDGNDYFIGEALLKTGVRPKIWVVEYNSVFGPDRRMSIRYQPEFRLEQGYRNSLYSGCSIAAWKTLMERNRYRFVSVDMSGVNAFFIDPVEFDAGFVNGLRGQEFRENHSHAREYKLPWREQFELIKDRNFVETSE